MNILLKRILCPVDFSTHADHAMRYGAALAEKFDAELTLLHVVAPIISVLPGESSLPEVAQARSSEIEAACRERLDKTIGELTARGVNVQCRVLNGVPYLEIVRFAKENATDLIVLGTHGRTGIAQLLIGSVAERVVRKAPCPVLTVKHPEHEFLWP
jgi:nucleotide-binding universal stress UspA family protein